MSKRIHNFGRWAKKTGQISWTVQPALIIVTAFNSCQWMFAMHPPPEGANPFLYTALVFLHIFTTMVAVGLNASYVIWILRGTKDAASLPFALRGVKFIDDYVANPCYLAGGVTGVLMILMGKPIAPFLWVAIGLYVLAMLVAYGVYTPLLSRQIRTLEAKGANDLEYQALARRSNQVGMAMGVLVVIILILKIFEPPLW